MGWAQIVQKNLLAEDDVLCLLTPPESESRVQGGSSEEISILQVVQNVASSKPPYL